VSSGWSLHPCRVSDDGLYSIGQLAERTGLSVRTIRFYSDEGVVPATGRSVAGYRRYDIHALARLDLVRTLRDLGLPLPTIRAVLDNGLSLPQVAAAHARALDTQIRRPAATACRPARGRQAHHHHR
jgi:DNA-binding transcriptional MerR regulator